jgi:hypothetical protein
MAINARLFQRDILTAATVRRFDGLESWKVLDDNFLWGYCPTRQQYPGSLSSSIGIAAAASAGNTVISAITTATASVSTTTAALPSFTPIVTDTSTNKPGSAISSGGKKRIVIKVGSSLVTNDGAGLDSTAIDTWALQMSCLISLGHEVLMVSSGAIAEGMQRLGWKNRPSVISELQAAAAVGQMGLIQVYETCFAKYNIKTAQVLLTNADLDSMKRSKNANATLEVSRQ